MNNNAGSSSESGLSHGVSPVSDISNYYDVNERLVSINVAPRRCQQHSLPVFPWDHSHDQLTITGPVVCQCRRILPAQLCAAGKQCQTQTLLKFKKLERVWSSELQVGSRRLESLELHVATLLEGCPISSETFLLSRVKILDQPQSWKGAPWGRTVHTAIGP